ncbi:hypothetical protein BC834DRAFT_1040694 [Gloeopeniophorella convolvens]|nr:hypothetical protein BC834DRAFT_1040694 [Gloeopeniophorella convolvens]
MLLRRLSFILGEHLAESSASVKALEAGLCSSNKTCDELRFSNCTLKVSSDTLQERLSGAHTKSEDLVKNVFALRLQFSKSLRSRESAAQAWLAYRKAIEPRYLKTSRQLMLMVLILWKYTRILAPRLSGSIQATSKTRAELAAARTMCRNAQSRYDSLMADYDLALEEVNSLKEKYSQQANELTEAQNNYCNLLDLHETATREAGNTQAILRDEQARLEQTNADLVDCVSRSECRLEEASAHCSDLETSLADTTRSSGMAIAMLSRHVERERVRIEVERTLGLRPMHDMMRDLRSRLAMADEYVKKISTPPRVRVGVAGTSRDLRDPSPSPFGNNPFPSPPVSEFGSSASSQSSLSSARQPHVA